MLQSMTGFGSATLENAKMSVTADVKTLNSKFTDIFCRIPRTFSDKEVALRKLLTTELGRGKMELILNVTSKDADNAGTTVNRTLVKAYYNDLMATASDLGFEAVQTDILRMATMMPNAYDTNAKSDEAAGEEWSLILDAVNKAIATCIEFRKQEGEVTQVKFTEYINNISASLKLVSEQAPKRIPVIREKIKKSVSDLVENEKFNQDRFEQELIYYVEKYDIAEEEVRLANHLDYFLKELDKGSTGKRLNFLSQEIGREINTIGSKANDAIIQRLVVEMKDQLEKIKEQTMNIV